jgi:hypothetical protein
MAGWRGDFSVTLCSPSGVLASLFVFLLSVTAGATAQVEVPKKFDFETSLRAPEFASQTRELLRGAILLPKRKGSEDLYQPVILCKSLLLHLDGRGVSQPVHVEGFCQAAAFEAVVGSPAEFEWHVSADYSPAVRIGGCDPGIIKTMRARQLERKGPWNDLGPAPWYSSYDKPFDKCLDIFQKEVYEDFHLELEALTRRRICYFTPILVEMDRKWEGCLLECWPQLLKAHCFHM